MPSTFVPRTGLLALLVGIAVLPGCLLDPEPGDPAQVPTLSHSPTELPFGSVLPGATRAIDVTVTNDGGTSEIVLGAFSLDGVGPEFTVTQPVPTVLHDGDSATVTVTFAPADTIDDQGMLVIPWQAEGKDHVTRIPITTSFQPADLLANPDPIDFGDVPCGTAKDLDVVLTNYGSLPITFQSLSLELGGSPDFSMETVTPPADGSLPLSLQPGERLGLVLRYAPKTAGSALSLLLVSGTLDGIPASWAFNVTGASSCPELVVAPGQADLGWVQLGATASLQVQLMNLGLADLVIPAGGVALRTGSHPDLVVQDPPQQDLVIAANSAATLTLAWAPKAVFPQTADPIGTLDIASNDSAHSPTSVPIFGNVDAPCLVAIPDTIDMGFAAEMTPIARMVTLRNDCHGTLTIASITVVDASDGGTSGDFTLAVDGGSDGTILAFEIPGNASRAVTVRFTARGPAAHVTATLRIASDDPAHPTVDLPISVSITGPGPCKVVLVPAALAFDATTVGSAVEKTVNLVNTGTGFCTFQHAAIADCPAGTDGTPVCPDSLPGDPSTAYSLTTLPPVVVNGLAPGSSTPITVRFAPPAAGADPSAPLAYPALLSVTVKDPLQGSTIELPKSGPGGTYAPNVTGSALGAP